MYNKLICPFLSNNDYPSFVQCESKCALYDRKNNCCAFLSQANSQRNIVATNLEIINTLDKIKDSNYGIETSIIDFKDSFDYVFKDMEEHIEEVINNTVSKSKETECNKEN